MYPHKQTKHLNKRDIFSQVSNTINLRAQMLGKKVHPTVGTNIIRDIGTAIICIYRDLSQFFLLNTVYMLVHTHTPLHTDILFAFTTIYRVFFPFIRNHFLKPF